MLVREAYLSIDPLNGWSTHTREESLFRHVVSYMSNSCLRSVCSHSARVEITLGFLSRRYSALHTKLAISVNGKLIRDEIHHTHLKSVVTTQHLRRRPGSISKVLSTNSCSGSYFSIVIKGIVMSVATVSMEIIFLRRLHMNSAWR